MANQNEIDAEIQAINDKWDNPAARNGLFGNILKSVKIRAVRGIDTDIEFTWPVIAIAGTNGSGKTTLLQLCSAAYVKQDGGRNYKIGDWVRGALKGETPAFDEGSSISFSFWDDAPTVTIPYQKDRTRWGYPRRNNPQRNVEFVGIAAFAPRIERKDRLHVFRTQIQVTHSEDFLPELVSSISKVLGVAYDGGQNHTVGPNKGNWRDTLPKVSKNGASYAEPHMGAGEQKTIKLIQALEKAPPKSLILLEEPEITLHPDAQRGLAWYLMSLARRKGHQIVIATHSSELFETLPPEARLLLIRRAGGIEAIPRPPKLTIARELAGATRLNKDLILVEDIVGKAFLKEILRQNDKHLHDECCISAVGNTNDVYRLVKTLRVEGLRVVGVRDPDIGDEPGVGIFSLPGTLAPESLLLEPENINEVEALLNGTGEAFNRAKVAGLRKTGSAWSKVVFQALANELGVDREYLSDRLTLAWLSREGHRAKAKALVASMKASLG